MGWVTGHQYVDHGVLARHAVEKVNISPEEAARRRGQVNHLHERLAAYIAAHPDYALVKLRSSGSTAKHTAIRPRAGAGSDADVAAYVTAAAVGGVTAPEAGLLQWVRERCREVYGDTKDVDDFVVSEHAVGITMHGTKLKIDVAPVLDVGEPDDRGYLITRQGTRVLTSVTQHLAFFASRRSAAGAGYPELIRLLKAWVREGKINDPDLRCKSFLLELIVAHLWDRGWRGEALQVNDYPRAFEQVLGYIASTGLSEPIRFDDFYAARQTVSSTDPIQVWDPVNPANNVACTYTEADRVRLVEFAADALDQISWAAVAPTKGAATDAWRTLLGPSVGGA